MKAIKRTTAGFLLLVMVVSLCACGGKQYSEENAVNYVQGVIDASYKGDYKVYVDEIGVSEEDAIALHEDVMDTTMNESLGVFDVSEEKKAEMKDAIKQLIETAKYEVGNATKNSDDEFSVEVTAYPFIQLSTLDDDVQKIADEELAKMSMEEIAEFADEAKAMEWSAGLVANYIKTIVANPVYGDAVVVEIRVQKNSEGNWDVNRDDTVNFANVILGAN